MREECPEGTAQPHLYLGSENVNNGGKFRVFDRDKGEVLVFGLLDHPTAPKCYAWEVDGEVTAVLHEAPVDSPQAAVRAAIATGHKGGEG